jgi:hypothetical protein
MNLLNEGRIRCVSVATVAGTSTVYSSAVDTDQGDDITFFCTIATANSGNYLKIQQHPDDQFGTEEDLAGSKTIGLVNADVVAAEVYRPTKRYVRAAVIRGASTALGEIFCIQKGARKLPVDNNEASEIVSTLVVSPAEGTA